MSLNYLSMHLLGNYYSLSRLMKSIDPHGKKSKYKYLNRLRMFHKGNLCSPYYPFQKHKCAMGKGYSYIDQNYLCNGHMNKGCILYCLPLKQTLQGKKSKYKYLNRLSMFRKGNLCNLYYQFQRRIYLQRN